jgi:hypothetical protein
MELRDECMYADLNCSKDYLLIVTLRSGDRHTSG